MRKHLNNIFLLVLPVLFVLTVTLQAAGQVKRKSVRSKIQTARVFITDQGYSRTSINLRRGVPTQITFLRQTDTTCATDIVIPEYGINRPLPLNTSIVVSFTPTRSGEVGFTCGMNMMRGKLIVR